MIYLDTSFVLPLFISEATSEQVAARLQQISADELALSLWTKTEFASALARRVRMEEITPATADEAITRFARMLENSCEVWVPSPDDFEQAVKLLQNFDSGLRAGDALHLAIVLNHEAECLYTLDGGLEDAAKALHIAVENILSDAR